MAPCLGATDYWVDPVNGNDANSGETEEEAYATVAYACYHVADGAKIWLLTGTYPTITLTAAGYPTRTQYTTISPDPDASPAPLLRKIYIERGVAWYLDWNDLTITYEDTGETVPTNYWLLYAGAGNHLKFRGCTITGVMNPAPGDPRWRGEYRPHSCIKIGRSSMNNSLWDVTIDSCTMTKAAYGIYFSTDYCGDNVEITNNDISITDCAGIMMTHDWTKDTGPTGEKVLVEGNYIHNQAEVYTGGYLTANVSHGSGFYVNSNHLTITRNRVQAYGNTASVRTYPVPDHIVFTDVTITNNLIWRPINVALELYNLATGSAVNHNTVVGTHGTGSGLTYFENSATNTTITMSRENTAQFTSENDPDPDVTGVQVCNNVLLCECSANVKAAGGLFTGNLIWSFTDSFSQTAMNALFPGNKIYCDSAVDTNSVTFTVGGTFFAGGTWFDDHAFTPAAVVDSLWTAGDIGVPDHSYDLVATGDAVNFGDPLYTATVDFWGSARGALPDSGFDEAPVDEIPGDDEPNPPEPNAPATKYLWLLK